MSNKKQNVELEFGNRKISVGVQVSTSDQLNTPEFMVSMQKAAIKEMTHQVHEQYFRWLIDNSKPTTINIMYPEDIKQELKRVLEEVRGIILKNESSGKPIGIFISHDLVTHMWKLMEECPELELTYLPNPTKNKRSVTWLCDMRKHPIHNFFHHTQEEHVIGVMIDVSPKMKPIVPGDKGITAELILEPKDLERVTTYLLKA